jgi:hypothetical protein
LLVDYCNPCLVARGVDGERITMNPTVEGDVAVLENGADYNGELFAASVTLPNPFASGFLEPARIDTGTMIEATGVRAKLSSRTTPESFRGGSSGKTKLGL